GCGLAWEVHDRWPGAALLISSGITKPAPDDLPPNARFLSKPLAPERLVKELTQALRRLSKDLPGTAPLARQFKGASFVRTAPGVLSLCKFGQSQPIINLLRTPGMIDQIAPRLITLSSAPTSRQLLSILGSACNRRTEG